jgi:hypothetical protein
MPETVYGPEQAARAFRPAGLRQLYLYAERLALAQVRAADPKVDPATAHRAVVVAAQGVMAADPGHQAAVAALQGRLAALAPFAGRADFAAKHRQVLKEHIVGVVSKIVEAARALAAEPTKLPGSARPAWGTQRIERALRHPRVSGDASVVYRPQMARSKGFADPTVMAIYDVADGGMGSLLKKIRKVVRKVTPKAVRKVVAKVPVAKSLVAEERKKKQAEMKAAAAANLQVKREAAAKTKTEKAALAAIHKVTAKQAQNMLTLGAAFIDKPEGVAASPKEVFLEYNGVIYRAPWNVKLPTAARVAEIRATATEAVAAGATPQDATAAAIAQDAQLYPGQPLVPPTATPQELMAASQPMYQEAVQAAAPPMSYQQAQETLQPQPSPAQAAEAELVYEEEPGDVQTQEAAGAIEAKAALQTGAQVAERVEVEEGAEAEGEEDEAEGEAEAEPSEGGEYKVVSPGEEEAIYQKAQAAQVEAARKTAQAERGGFWGMGAMAKAKQVARHATRKALDKGVPPAQAVAVGARAGQRYFATGARVRKTKHVRRFF